MLPACLVCTSEAVVGIVAGSIIAGVIDWLTLGIGLDGGLLPLSMLADEAIDGLLLCPTGYAPLKLASPAGNNVVCSLALVVISNIDRALSTVCPFPAALLFPILFSSQMYVFEMFVE